VKCLFCDKGEPFSKAEHIVPESLGNLTYILKVGFVCDVCNVLFSKFEKKVLTQTIYGFERVRRAVRTKKNRPSESKTNIRVKGNESFTKNLVHFTELSEQDFLSYDPQNNLYKITVKNFDKSESAMSKFLLKVGIESIFKSQRELYSKHDFSEAKDYLINNSNLDWPFTLTHERLGKEISIPKYGDKHHLALKNIGLSVGVFLNELIFRFSYGKIETVISLTSRNLEWVREILKNDPFKEVYPIHFKNKVFL
jgi:hypothetical protein